MVIAEMAELGVFTSSDGSDELSQDKKIHCLLMG